MGTRVWRTSVFDGQAPSLTPNYLIGQLNAGETVLRSLLWVECINEYTSFDPLAGTATLLGLTISNSNSVPPANLYNAWLAGSTYDLLWSWSVRFDNSVALPGSSPQQYVGMGDINKLGYQNIETQRKNTTSAPQYLWFTGAVNPASSVVSLTTTTAFRWLVDVP